MTITLIELNCLDQYTYVDTDGIIKMLDFEAEYDAIGGSVESFSVTETDTIALPWLHDYKRWLFRTNINNQPDPINWDDLPF